MLPSIFKEHLPMKRANHEPSSFLFSYLYVFVTLGYLLVVGLGFIYLQRETMKLEEERKHVRQKIERMNKERENLLLEREKYLQAEYILPRARQLGLQPALPNQVRILPSVVSLRVQEKIVLLKRQETGQEP